MKNLSLFSLLGISICLTVGCISASSTFKREEVGPDNVTYSEDKIITLDEVKAAPVVKAASFVYPNKFILHYHNDDAGNKERAFYFWSDGVNGKEFPYDTVSSDGKDMQIEVDFANSKYSMFGNKKTISFIIKPKGEGNWAGQSDDVKVDFAVFPPKDGVVEIWSIPAEGSEIEIYDNEEDTKMDRAVSTTFTDWKHIDVIATRAPEEFKVYAYTSNYFKYNNVQQEMYKENYLLTSGASPAVTDFKYNNVNCKKFTISLEFTVHINVRYVVETRYSTKPEKWQTKLVTFDSLYNTKRFNTYYNYEGSDLGATYTKQATTFKLWAPTASRVTLLLYTSGTPSTFEFGNDDARGFDMVFQKGGIWQLTVEGDLNKQYYAYSITNSNGLVIAADPYAKACGVNGVRSMVLDFSTTNPDKWNEVPEVWDGQVGFDISRPNDLTVYESHIRDLTIDSTWNGKSKPGTYSAYIESGTTYTKGDKTVTTGFDHLTELGVKAIQLLPVFDNDNDESNPSFNWGYNPVNYNCVEGGYSNDPFTGVTRVKEFKKLVQAFALNKNHTRIIMDVVYNHVSSAPSSCFTKIMPRYYFRYEPTSSAYYNGSGCGNEVRTEAPMMSKYIVDSLCWWAKEYKIKGFRFDLMGLIDTITLKKAATELYKIDPDIVMYGEGWNGDGDGWHGSSDTHGAMTAAVYSDLYATDSSVAVGGFNDHARNAFRGGNDQGWGSKNHLPGWGYMSQGAGDASYDNQNILARMFWGIHSDGSNDIGQNPRQTVNYVSCHDNWTLFDQYYYTLGDGTNPGSTKNIINASIATHAAIMASNGIAFMQGGEEIYRSKEVNEEARKEVKSSTYEKMYKKYVSHNSYDSPDSVNSYKWDRKLMADGVDTSSYVSIWPKLIKLHSTMKKFDWRDSGFPYSKTSAGKPIENISWAGTNYNGSEYHGCCGFQLDEYFIFVGGREQGSVPFGDLRICGKAIFSAGSVSAANSSIVLGNNKSGFAIVIYNRGVK